MANVINPRIKPTTTRGSNPRPEKEKLDCGDIGEDTSFCGLISTTFPSHTSFFTAFFRGFFFSLLR